MKHLTFPEYKTATEKWIVIVDFFAQRCPPCKMIAPILEQRSEKLTWKVDFYKVDVDEQQYLSWIENIRAMPTIKIYHEWVMVEEIVGADVDRVANKINMLLASNT